MCKPVTVSVRKLERLSVADAGVIPKEIDVTIDDGEVGCLPAETGAKAANAGFVYADRICLLISLTVFWSGHIRSIGKTAAGVEVCASN